MNDYIYQYRRESRASFTITADSQEDADIRAGIMTQSLNLSGPDDESDDPGETELIEVVKE